jgi:YhcH/YjgK/YiaL family protein
MIINALKNISLYKDVYKHLPEAIAFLQKNDFSELVEGKNEFSDNFYIVKIKGEKNPNFEGVLEVHKEWIDIHIPLNTNDIIAYKELSYCRNIEKEYNEENDYMLYREQDSCIAVLPIQYFCIIDTTMTHMAMLGEGIIEKLVIKIRK